MQPPTQVHTHEGFLSELARFPIGFPQLPLEESVGRIPTYIEGLEASGGGGYVMFSDFPLKKIASAPPSMQTLPVQEADPFGEGAPKCRQCLGGVLTARELVLRSSFALRISGITCLVL